MKKFFKSREAGLPIAVGVLVVVFIAVFMALMYSTAGSGKSYWETESEFGTWTEEIDIEYTDGTSQSLKLVMDGEASWNPMAVKYNGKEISRISYSISGIATGTGYTGAKVDVSDLSIKYDIFQMPGYILKEAHAKQFSGTVDITVLGQKTELAKRTLDPTFMEDNPPSIYPDGTYKWKFTPSGTVRYDSIPAGAGWRYVGLPPGREITVQLTRTPLGKIAVTLYSDLVAS